MENPSLVRTVRCWEIRLGGREKEDAPVPHGNILEYLMYDTAL